MKRYWILPFLLLFLVSFSNISFGQAAEDLLDEGRAAFREGRYSEAVRAFEGVTALDPDNAEAYFLLARIYAETPLEDRKKANVALEKAIELEPDNLTYLVGSLQQLRVESWNFFTERIRETKRLDIAKHILKIDSTNAYAHEEIGGSFIRDFWRYRNAIMLPTLHFVRPTMVSNINEAYLGTLDADALNELDQFLLAQLGDEIEMTETDRTHTTPNMASLYSPDDVFMADRFDLESLRAQGIPIQDLSYRAQRAYDRAIGHLRASLQADPRRRSVYDSMMEIFALKGEYEDALEMLQEMYIFFPEDDKTWLYLGFAHCRSGNPEAAYRSFQTAFTYMDEGERQAFDNIEYILPEGEVESYKDDPIAYVSRFWTSKDPRYLTPFNERRLEHFARLVYVDLLYDSKDLKLRGWETQRGQILIRYGVPLSDVVIMPQNTSMSAKRVLEMAMAGPTDAEELQQERISATDQSALQTRILLDRGSGFDMAAEANSFNVWDYGDFRFVFEDPFRNGEYRLYSPSATEVAAGVDPWINDYTIRIKETFRKVPERYEYEAPGRQIEIPYLVTIFKGDGEEADLYVHYGIPITAENDPNSMINVTANVGAFLISEDRDILVERRRTVYGLRNAQIMEFKDTNLWVDTQEMQAPSGNHEVSMEFETASGATVAVQRRNIEVPRFTEERLTLSDMMLAYQIEESDEKTPASASDITRYGLSITPAPWSVFSATQPIYLYFEIYNLELNQAGQTDYEMEALLIPKDKGRGLGRLVRNIFGGTGGVSVTVPGAGDSLNDAQYLILDAANQETGLYTLVLRVRDNVGRRTVETEQDLFLE